MRILTDITCKRCGCTTSTFGCDPTEVAAAHVCPDGARHTTDLVMSERRVYGPGERLSDERK